MVNGRLSALGLRTSRRLPWQSGTGLVEVVERNRVSGTLQERSLSFASVEGWYFQGGRETFVRQDSESLNQTLRNSSFNEILKARAIFSMLTRATFRSPRPIPPR